MSAMPTDTDAAKWSAHANIRTFDEAARMAAKSWHRGRHPLRSMSRGFLARELTGPELLEWHEQNGDHPGVEVVDVDGNLLTLLGLARIGNRLIGTASNQAIDATHCRIGVGNATTAATTADTDLGAASGSGNRQFKLVDSIAQGTGANSGKTTIVATFASAQANFTWNEWGIDGGTSDGTTVVSDANTTPGLVNHKINAGMITKSSAVVAVFAATITIS